MKYQGFISNFQKYNLAFIKYVILYTHAWWHGCPCSNILYQTATLFGTCPCPKTWPWFCWREHMCHNSCIWIMWHEYGTRDIFAVGDMLASYHLGWGVSTCRCYSIYSSWAPPPTTIGSRCFTLIDIQTLAQWMWVGQHALQGPHATTPL